MVDKEAVKTIYDIISAHHKQFCLLHCISAYPVPFEDCNLTVLQDYKNTFDIPVGYSGQEVGTAVALGAVALGAKVIVKYTIIYIMLFFHYLIYLSIFPFLMKISNNNN